MASLNPGLLPGNFYERKPVDKHWLNTKIFYDLSKTHTYHNIVIVRLLMLTQICIIIL